MVDLPDDIHECNFFGLLNQQELDDILPMVTVKHASYGQFFPLSHTHHKKIYGTLRGALKIVELDSEGEELFKYIAFKGDLFGGILSDHSNDFAYVISKDAVFLSLDYGDFNDWIRKHPRLSYRYEEKLSVLIRSLQDWFFSMMRFDVKSRLLYFIKLLAQKDGIQNNRYTTIERRFTQDELASILFTSRQSIVRAMRELIEEGKINFDRKSIAVNDELNEYAFSD